MKLLVSALFLVSSMTALSASNISSHAFEYFHGRGYYETPSGHKGKFLASLMVKKHGGKYSLRYSVHSRHHDMEFKIGLGKPEASGIFAVTHKGGKVGYGYCVEGHVCHLNYGFDGVDVEETIYIHKHGKHGRGHKHASDEVVRKSDKGKRMFFSMGSKSRDGMIKKTWVMHLHKVY